MYHVHQTMKLIVIAFCISSVNSVKANEGDFSSLDLLSRIGDQSALQIREKLILLEKKQIEFIQENKQKLDSVSLENAAEVKLAVERGEKALEVLSAALDYLVNGNVPQEPRLRKITPEVIVWLLREVWVVCQGLPWIPSNEKTEFGPFFKNHAEAFRLQSLATGRIDTYDAGSDAFRSVVGTAIAIGPNHVVTNKHVIIDGDIGYKHLASGELKLYSRTLARIFFPVEYENCDPPAQKVNSEVTIEAIEYTHPTLDFVIARVKGELGDFIQFPAERDQVVGNRIAVIGYTSRPDPIGTFFTSAMIDEIFGSPDGKVPFTVQRLSEGLSITNYGEKLGYFRYDATTWHGNSGSMVSDLSTGEILGLHSGGRSSAVEGKGYNKAVGSEFLARAISSIGL